DLVAAMRTWASAGGEVQYVEADLADPAGAARAVAAARTAFGRLHGVIHCAGTRRDAVYLRKAPEDFPAGLGPKAPGALPLAEAPAGDELDFFALFSSLSASVANPGQADYAAANAYLEAFAARRGHRTVAIGWPYWAEGGMRVPDEALRRS